MKHRSWLFVPGDSKPKLSKISGCGADIAIIDLEDSVAPEGKSAARKLTAEFVGSFPAGRSPDLWVRINPVSSGIYPDDLNAVVEARPAGLVLPKPRSIEDVRIIDDYVSELEALHALVPGSIRLLSIATETAASVMNLAAYQQSPQRLWGLTWGAEDLAADLGANGNKDEAGEYRFVFDLARAMCQLSAAAAGLAAIESVVTDFKDSETLGRRAEQARRDGFVGMMAIHPSQVGVINEAFTPTAEELRAARRILAAFESEPGAGVVSLDGRMLDRPHLLQAERILRMAD